VIIDFERGGHSRRFQAVETLADLESALSHFRRGDVRAITHTGLMQERQEANSRLKSQQGIANLDALASLLAGFYPNLLARLEAANITTHPEVAMACARMLASEGEP
jgi:hypothetical protein